VGSQKWCLSPQVGHHMEELQAVVSICIKVRTSD
jgi:hypothetical protein